jgi:hypothetical protein
MWRELQLSAVVTLISWIGSYGQSMSSKLPVARLQVFTVSSSEHGRTNFDDLKAELRTQTTVWLELPAFLPYGDVEHPIAASVVAAGPDGYEIALGWGEDCFEKDLPGGAGACHYGSIEASVKGFQKGATRTPVELRRGMHGYFEHFTCGAHCEDASLEWNQNGCYYRFSLKAGSKNELIRVAESAIAQGRSETRRH